MVLVFLVLLFLEQCHYAIMGGVFFWGGALLFLLLRLVSHMEFSMTSGLYFSCSLLISSYPGLFSVFRFVAGFSYFT